MSCVKVDFDFRASRDSGQAKRGGREFPPSRRGGERQGLGGGAPISLVRLHGLLGEAKFNGFGKAFAPGVQCLPSIPKGAYLAPTGILLSVASVRFAHNMTNSRSLKSNEARSIYRTSLRSGRFTSGRHCKELKELRGPS
jgi:hypothetical protein